MPEAVMYLLLILDTFATAISFREAPSWEQASEYTDIDTNSWKRKAIPPSWKLGDVHLIRYTILDSTYIMD